MDMQALIKGFPFQLEDALRIGKSAQLKKPQHEIRNVLVSGLGGSGIGGTIISEFAFPVCPVPVAVTKGYFIPEYVNENTLVIISSYSGNTEETLACMEQSIARKAHIICITSGGKVSELAKKNNIDQINFAGGMPPRACLGYSLTQQVCIFSHLGLLPSSAVA